jgi:hypothetical protein
MYETETPAVESAEGEDPRVEKLEKARRFLRQILDRETKFKSGWWKRAEDSEKQYGQYVSGNEQKYSSVYNILYSNTEVLLPSLYSATAKPDVRARFKDANLKPIPDVIERFLALLTDSAAPGEESFDEAVKDSVLSSLTAATGCLRLRHYEADPFPLRVESVAYKNIIWSNAKKWARVSWVAFKHELTKEEFQTQLDLSDEEMAVNYKSVSNTSDKDSTDCVLYEFWHKPSQTVWFLSEDWQDCYIRDDADPLKLSGFFPTPGLLMLTLKPGNLEPIPLYWYYRNQAEELDRISTRLNKVLSAIKVRGAYNSMLSIDMEKILSDTEMENGLVPAGESLALAQGGGFDKQIWLLPLEKLIQVAESLYRAREAAKQVIYELTGISDIIRGSNVASETATATNTKDKWGTLRLRKMQTVVADYVRDMFRLAVDAGTSVVPAETWKRLVQLPIPTAQEQAVAQQTLQFKQQQAQEMQAQMPPPAPGAPPPQIPPPDPALVAQAQGPSMEQILQQMASDVNRTYTINIQTSSTVDLDTAQDKGEVSEFMNALGQMSPVFQQLMPLGPSGLEAVKSLLAAVCKRYKFGIPIVDIIESIKPPPPPQPPPPDPRIAADVEMTKMEMQGKVQENQVKLQLANIELQKAQAEFQLKQQEHAFKLQELEKKMALMSAQHEQAMLTALTKPATIPAKPGPSNAPLRRKM